MSTHAAVDETPLDVAKGVDYSWLLLLLLLGCILLDHKPEESFLFLTFLETYLMPGALAMISSLIALLNLIFAFFLSARISLYLHRKRINKLESPLNLFLKSTIQVVNRLRGEGATLVLNKKDEGFFPGIKTEILSFACS